MSAIEKFGGIDTVIGTEVSLRADLKAWLYEFPKNYRANNFEDAVRNQRSNPYGSDNVPEISSVRPVRAYMPQSIVRQDIVGLTESTPDSTLGAKDLTFRMRTYMDEHYRTLSAVFPIILREIDGDRQVLLHRRANTGYMDGKWDFAGSGHVEQVETAKMAVVRECIEELGIIVDADDVRFAHLSHRLGRQGARTYYDIYFIVHKYDGVPMIAEPEKCSALEWFSIDALPMEMIDLRRRALEDCLKGIPYSEIITKPQQD